MNMKIKADLIEMKETSLMKDIPQINTKSKKIAQQKVQTDLAVHERLYEKGKQPGLLTGNEVISIQDLNSGKDKNGGKGLENGELSFRPKIHKRSQMIQRDKPVE